MGKVDDLLAGSLGTFWSYNESTRSIDEPPDQGYVRQEGGWADLELLDDAARSESFMSSVLPDAIWARTPGGVAAFLELAFVRRTRTFGAASAVKRYRARTILAGPVLLRLNSMRFTSLGVTFYGISQWSGMSSMSERIATGPRGLPKRFELVAETASPSSASLVRGGKMNLRATWSVSGGVDRRTMSSPVEVEIERSRPGEIWELLEPLLCVQDLVNMAFGGFVAASTGHAKLDAEPAKRPEARQATRLDFWNGALMVPQAETILPMIKENSAPLFVLEDLGGIAGIRRWVAVFYRHKRSLSAVTSRLRFGRGTPEAELKDIAAAIEIWVKAHRPAAWADSKQYATVLAKHVGSDFGDWVGGDVARWSKVFWGTYDRVKHDPLAVLDEEVLAILAQSGRVLLTVAALNQTAGSKSIGKKYLEHHVVAAMGQGVRLVLDTT